jgi:hypothetical protein
MMDRPTVGEFRESAHIITRAAHHDRHPNSSKRTRTSRSMYEPSIERMLRARSAGALMALVFTICTINLARAARPKSESPIEVAKQAAAQFNLGHLEEAISLYEKAYEIDPDPMLLFNLGQCHRLAGNDERALFFYQRYLDQVPRSAFNRQEVEALVSELERSVEEQSARKKKPPPGVNQANSTDLPASEPATNADVRSDAVKATPENATAQTQITNHPTSPTQTNANALTAQESSPEEFFRHNRRLLAWTVGAGAVISLAVGGWGLVAWSDRAKQFNEHVGPAAQDPSRQVTDCSALAPKHGGQGCETLYEKVSTARTVTIAASVTGGTLVVISAIFFLTSIHEEHSSATTVGCSPNLLSRGALCQFSF